MNYTSPAELTVREYAELIITKMVNFANPSLSSFGAQERKKFIEAAKLGLEKKLTIEQCVQLMEASSFNIDLAKSLINISSNIGMSFEQLVR